MKDASVRKALEAAKALDYASVQVIMRIEHIDWVYGKQFPDMAHLRKCLLKFRKALRKAEE